MHNFSWYPGHIKAAEEELKKKWLPLIDLIIEVVDARVPISGIYPKRELWLGKSIINVFSKKDLTDLKTTLSLINKPSLVVDARLPHEWKKKLIDLIKKTSLPIKHKLQAQGRKRNLRIGICGLPNVGKSTFLNSLGGLGKKAKTGDKPGITRQMQFIQSPEFDLLDTPGIMPHSLEQEVSYKLAVCGLLPDKLFDKEDLKNYLLENYPQIKAADHIEQSAELLIKRFQEGKLGKICLD